MDARLLECGAHGAALRTPSKRRQRFRHLACGAASQQPLSSSRLVRPAKAAPEVAALQKPLPPSQPQTLNGRETFWSAAPTGAALRTPSERRQRFRHSACGTASQQPPSSSRLCGQRKRRLKSPHSKSRCRPAQPRTLNGRETFSECGARRRRFTDALETTPTVPALSVWHREPTTVVVEPTVRPAKAASEVAALQKPVPPSQPQTLEWTRDFLECGAHRRRFTDALGATPTVPARSVAAAASQQPLSVEPTLCGQRKRRLKSPHSKSRCRPASRER
jgi:hypothetical protein